MNSNKLVGKALSFCLTVAILAAYSITTLAGGKAAGQLLITSTNADAFVKVNGQAVQNGSSVSSSSMIATPEDTSAVIDLGKIGKIELAPRTTLAITFGEKGISGDLLAGQINVLDASREIILKTPDGKLNKLKAGESLAAGKAADDDDKNNNGHKKSWWIWGAVIGGAVAAVVIFATTRGDDDIEGGCVTILSGTGSCTLR